MEGKRPDVLVIGGGFFGVATAAYLARKGLWTALLDQPLPGASSRAGSGYASPRWVGRDLREGRRALETAMALGLRLRPLLPLHYRVKDYEPLSPPKDLYVFDRDEYLLGLYQGIHLVGTATRIDVANGGADTSGGFVVWRNDVRGAQQPPIEARSVVLALGHRTDEFLRDNGLLPVGVKGLPGSAAYYPGSPVSYTWLKVGPYKHYAIRPWGDDMTRLCATVERNEAAVQRERDKMLAAGRSFIPSAVNGARPVRWETGIRPVISKGAPLVQRARYEAMDGSQREHKGLVVATGGGRVGALAAFLAAEQAYSMLRRDLEGIR